MPLMFPEEEWCRVDSCSDVMLPVSDLISDSLKEHRLHGVSAVMDIYMVIAFEYHTGEM